MQIVHNKEVNLLREVTGVEQALIQQIVGTVEEAYLVDIRNRTTDLINDTVAGILTHLQQNYGQLILHELLEQEDIVKNTNYNPHDPITTVFSSVKELLDLSEITGTSYTQLQAVNTFYMIIHRMGNFGLTIHEWNRIPEIHKMWVRFK